MDCKSLGKRVAKMRRERRWEVQDLAHATGLTYQSLWRIERGTQGEPGAFTLAKIAKALGCSVDYLVGLYEEDEDSDSETVLVLGAVLVGEATAPAPPPVITPRVHRRSDAWVGLPKH